MLDYRSKTTFGGFTLIEMLIYLGVVSIFVTGAVYFVLGIVRIQTKAGIQRSLSHNLDLVSKRITYEVTRARAINTASGSVLSLSSLDINRDPTVFDLQSGRVRLGFGNVAPCPVTAPCYLTDNKINITSLIFSQVLSGTESASVKFAIGASNVTGSSQWNYSKSYTGSVELR